MARSAQEFMQMIQENDIKMIDFKIVDINGQFRHVTIPASTQYIESWAFADCTSLESITFEGTMEQWNWLYNYTTWNQNVPATQVVCSDGIVSLN